MKHGNKNGWRQVWLQENQLTGIVKIDGSVLDKTNDRMDND